MLFFGALPATTRSELYLYSAERCNVNQNCSINRDKNTALTFFNGIITADRRMLWPNGYYLVVFLARFACQTAILPQIVFTPEKVNPLIQLSAKTTAASCNNNILPAYYYMRCKPVQKTTKGRLQVHPSCNDSCYAVQS